MTLGTSLDKIVNRFNAKNESHEIQRCDRKYFRISDLNPKSRKSRRTCTPCAVLQISRKLAMYFFKKEINFDS